MSELQFQLIRGGGFVVAVLAALTLQRLSPHARLRGAWRVNGGLWLINLVVMGVVCGACACQVARWARAMDLGILNAVRMPWAVEVALTIVGLDLVSYLWHRANHRLPLLWRFHRVHHSDTTFTVSTGIRFHPGELLLSLPIRLCAVVIAGAPAEAIVLFEVLFAIANLVEHGDISLPLRWEARLGRVLVTPALHRWHHSRQRPALDSNFGTIFALWDRLFATYAYSASHVAVETGMPDGSGRICWRQALALPWSPGGGGTAPPA